MKKERLEYVLRARYMLGGCLEIFKIKECKARRLQKFYLFGIPFMVKHFQGTKSLELLKQIDFVQSICLPALLTHRNTFLKYKGIHSGRDIVIVGTGPTLDKYEPIENALHIGVNRAIFCEKIKLDYLFIQDYFEDLQDSADAYCGNNCKKFYGYHYMPQIPAIPEKNAAKANAERYYFIDLPMPHQTLLPFPMDISTAPFGTFSSVILPAIQFALYTQPRRIFIVGCDCTNLGYCSTIKNSTTKEPKFPLSVNRLIYGWTEIKKFAERFYPETEIISINPIGLKGLFHDIFI